MKALLMHPDRDFDIAAANLRYELPTCNRNCRPNGPDRRIWNWIRCCAPWRGQDEVPVRGGTDGASLGTAADVDDDPPPARDPEGLPAESGGRPGALRPGGGDVSKQRRRHYYGIGAMSRMVGSVRLRRICCRCLRICSRRLEAHRRRTSESDLNRRVSRRCSRCSRGAERRLPRHNPRIICPN